MLEKSVKISTATASASSLYLSHEQHCVLEHLALCIVCDSCVSSLQKRDFFAELRKLQVIMSGRKCAYFMFCLFNQILSCKDLLQLQKFLT